MHPALARVGRANGPEKARIRAHVGPITAQGPLQWAAFAHVGAGAKPLYISATAPLADNVAEFLATRLADGQSTAVVFQDIHDAADLVRDLVLAQLRADAEATIAGAAQ